LALAAIIVYFGDMVKDFGFHRFWLQKSQRQETREIETISIAAHEGWCCHGMWFKV
jgi:hypothetical protein